MKRRHVLIVAGLLAAVGAGAFVLSRGGGGERGDSGEGETAEASGATAGGGQWWRRLPPQLPSGPTRGPSTFPPGVTPGPRPTGDVRKELEDYRRSAQYPPHSRRLGRDDERLLDPVAVPSQRRPAVDTEGESREPADYTFSFTGDRAMVTGRDVLTTTLAVFRGPDAVHAAPSRVVAAQLSPSSGGAPIGAPLGYVDDGSAGDIAAGDNVHTNQLSPHAMGITNGGYYAIDVAFTHPGGSSEGKLAFFYTPEDRVAGRFTGTLEDRIVDGSLVVSAEIEVIRAGNFVVDANLFDVAGSPIARATFTGALNEGRSKVDLLFFGKILRDVGLDGPYVVRHLRGYRALPGETPNREALASFDGEHRTRAYDVTEFSDAEWESAEKIRRIRMLEQLVAGQR